MLFRLGEMIVGDIHTDCLAIRKIYKVAVEFYKAALKNKDNKSAREFLENYDFDESIIKRFHLGYAPNEKDALYQLLISLGFSNDDILLSALVKQGSNSEFYDVFKNRIIIPIISAEGDFVSFCGRSVDNSNPKFVQISDTPLCKKNEQIFGLNLSENNTQLILCEGYFDVMKMHNAGFINAVSICSLEMSKKQLALIKNNADEVVILYDNDQYGQKMQKRISEQFNKYGIKYSAPYFDGAANDTDSVRVALSLLNEGYEKDKTHLWNE